MNYLAATNKFFPEEPSGSARVAWDIACMMKEKGHNVSMLCRKSDLSLGDEGKYDGIKVFRFTYPFTRNLDPFKMNKQKDAGAAIAKKYLSNTKWDVIHSHSPLYNIMCHEVFGDNVRHVYTSHSPVLVENVITWGSQGWKGKIKIMFGRGVLKRIEKKAMQNSDAIHALSEFNKSCIETEHGLGSKVVVIPHWCRDGFSREMSKSDARKQLNWPAKADIILSVRRLVVRMGLDDAIKAIAPHLKVKRQARYIIVGRGPLEKKLKDITTKLGVDKQVLFLGRVSDEILKRCYEAADLFLLPTRQLECFGIPMLESLSYGMPLVSTDSGAIPEIMRSILPQCVAPAGDVEKISEILGQYFDNKLNLPKSDELYSFVDNNYSKEIIVPKLYDFITGN